MAFQILVVHVLVYCTTITLSETRNKNVVKVPCRRLTEKYLRIQYAKFMEEYPEAFLHTYPKQFLGNSKKTLRGSKTANMLPCFQTQRQDGTPCRTKIVMDYKDRRYPKRLYQAQCCHYDIVGQGTGECVEGFTPKHVFTIRKHGSIARARMCTLKRTFQLLSVTCFWKCMKESPINTNSFPGA